MDQWNSHVQAGGGYFNDTPAPGSETKKSTARQQFLCPVTIRQILKSPEDGLKLGDQTVNMVTIMSVVTHVEVTSTNIKFTVSDDTGVIDCLDWIENEDAKRDSIMEGAYYQVFGTIKSPQGRRRIMVFKVKPVEDFNEIACFMMEVLCSESFFKSGYTAAPTPMEVTSAPVDQYDSSFTPVQKAILNAIKAANSQVGWKRDDPVMRSKFPPKLIDEAIEYLVGEGHIYSTIDDEHFCSTG